MAQRKRFMPDILNAYKDLKKHYDIIIVEGAGSPVEKNLPPPDIANMAFALETQTPVILIADIESGGTLAHIIGTYTLLTPPERTLVKGYIINKFRGDINILQPAFPIIHQHTNLKCLGTLPYHPAALKLPVEDSLALSRRARSPRRAQTSSPSSPSSPLRIVIPLTPHLANSDDIEPLRLHPNVHVCLAPAGAPLPAGDILLLLGSKAVLRDLAFIKEQGWHIDIAYHHRLKKPILGLCGGYQLLGKTINDPDGIEGIKGKHPALSLLNVHTRLNHAKTLTRTTSRHVATQQTVSGYEIHIGTTTGTDTSKPMLAPSPSPTPHNHGDGGASSPCGTIQGCYMHGIFTNDGFRSAYLNTPNTTPYHSQLQHNLDALADMVEHTIDIDALLAMSHTP